MRRAFGILVVLLLSSVSAVLSAEWAEYRPAKIGYAIDMPGEWKITTLPIKTAAGEFQGILASIETKH